MRKILLTAAGATALMALVSGGAALGQMRAEDLPPNPVAGHCYGKVLIPETYQTYTEQIVDSAARTELRIIPAVMGEATQQVVETEAHTEYVTIPATYKTVTETVVTRPATTRRVTVPATYETVTEKILVREAYTVWKRGDRAPTDIVVPGSAKLLPTGEVLCLVEIPAEYRTVTRQVVKTPETTREIAETAETTTVTRTVVDRAAQVTERKVPATYKSIRIKTVVQPERTETINVPATYKTVTKQRMVTQSHLEWREVDCKPEADTLTNAILGVSGGQSYATASRTVSGSAPSWASVASSTSATVRTTTTTTSTSGSVRAQTRTRSLGPLAKGGDSVTQTLQGALHDRGYYDGPFSGRFTSNVQLAMVKFQRDNHLAVGTFDAATAQALGVRTFVPAGS